MSKHDPIRVATQMQKTIAMLNYAVDDVAGGHYSDAELAQLGDRLHKTIVVPLMALHGQTPNLDDYATAPIVIDT